MITADTITDEQIQQLRHELLAETPRLVSTNEAIIACDWALSRNWGFVPEEVACREIRDRRRAALIRCVEILNAKNPPIKNETRVRATVRRAGKSDYSDKEIVARAHHHGAIGVVCEHHGSHGLCYGVRFEDDAVAYFDPEELEVVA